MSMLDDPVFSVMASMFSFKYCLYSSSPMKFWICSFLMIETSSIIKRIVFIDFNLLILDVVAMLFTGT